MIEEYNSHNCSLLGHKSVQHHWMNCRYGTEWAGLCKNSEGHIAPSDVSWDEGTDFHPSVKEGGDLAGYSAHGGETDVPACSAGGSSLWI